MLPKPLCMIEVLITLLDDEICSLVILDEYIYMHVCAIVYGILKKKKNVYDLAHPRNILLAFNRCVPIRR